MSTTITGVRTIGVPVTDQDRAVEFHVGTLGSDRRPDVPVERLGGRWIEVAPPGSMTAIALVVDKLLRWEGVPPMLAFRDPDGNGLEVVE